MSRLFCILLVVFTALSPSKSLAFDPISDDFSGFVMAAKLTPGSTADGATLQLSARHPDGRVLDHVFQLVAVDRPRGAPGAAAFFYALDPDDKGRLSALRGRIAAWKRDAPGTKGSLSFGLDLGSRKGVRGSLWVSPKEGAPFQRILRNAPLS